MATKAEPESEPLEPQEPSQPLNARLRSPSRARRGASSPVRAPQSKAPGSTHVASLEEIQAEWLAMRPKDEDEAEEDKYHGHKGGKAWHVGKGCAGGEEHNKWILGLINMGGPRKDGQQDYNWNLFNMFR